MLLIPTLAALTFGGLRMASAVRDSLDATRAASVANALPDSFRLALQLQVERETGSAPKVPAKILGPVQATTDAAIQAWRVRLREVDSSRDVKLRRDLSAISGTLGDIDELRAELAEPMTRLTARTEYTDTLDLLLGLAGRLPDLDSAHDLYRQATGLGQVRTAAEALAEQRTLVTKALVDGEIGQSDLTALATATESYRAASGFFYANTSPRAQTGFEAVNGSSGAQRGSHAPMQTAVESLLGSGDPETMQLDVDTWNAAAGDYLAQMAGVISTAADDLAQQVDARRAAAQEDAIISAATVLAVLLLALIATIVVARSILRPLNRLREAALDIARQGLPERVRALEGSAGADDLSVSPIHVGSRDEIADVASAFDAVHAEAVRLAGEQTQIRTNVNRMFVNLSRRSQSLVERQLRLIDELESGEQDPEHLASLFRLDHLATRMRRNDESLLVLAGGDTGQGARGPVPVLDVLRAASSEVEQFSRVEIESGEVADLRGSVAGDLVHLLAELIENATNFSPPDSSVVVGSMRTSPESPLVVEVRDLGIGMTPHELVFANEKLRSPRGLDADVARMMGLVVASRLADRHGLVVELRANSPRGVVARVEVPTSMLLQPETPAVPPVDAVDAFDALPEPIAPVETAVSGPVGAVASAAEPAADEIAAAVQPPADYTPPAAPIASEPLVESWFSTTVPLRDPEELLNSYLTGRAAGVDGAIRTPFATAPERPDRPDRAAPLSSSGLPTRVPRSNVPAEPRPEPETEAQLPAGPVLDPLIVELAADVLSAPTAEEAFDEAFDEAAEQDDSSIFATMQSEWFTRRTPLQARRAQPNPTGSGSTSEATGWASPGDEGWRRAAEVSDAATEERDGPVTSGGLPMRVPGRNLVPGSAPTAAPTPAPATTTAPVAGADNLVPLPRLERRRTRGLSSFQQGVSRARTTDSPESPEGSDEMIVPGAHGATESQAHEEHQ